MKTITESKQFYSFLLTSAATLIGFSSGWAESAPNSHPAISADQEYMGRASIGLNHEADQGEQTLPSLTGNILGACVPLPMPQCLESATDRAIPSFFNPNAEHNSSPSEIEPIAPDYWWMEPADNWTDLSNSVKSTD